MCFHQRVYRPEATLLATLLDEFLSGCHDDVLGFGSDVAYQKRLQRLGPDVLVNLENIAHHPRIGTKSAPVRACLKHIVTSLARAVLIAPARSSSSEI